MQIRNLYPGAMASNCYLLTSGQHAVLVDPSAPVEAIRTALYEEQATLDAILLTHGHFDHVFALSALRDATGAKVFIHEYDFAMPDDPRKNAFRTFFGKDRAFGKPDKSLRDGDTVAVGDESLRVLHTPGHTAGSVCYLCAGQFLLTGDTLFADTYGRTDLYSGNASQLLDSLEGLRALAPSLTIYPGHGEPALLGHALDNVLY